MDKLKHFQEGSTAHRMLPAWVWRHPAKAFATLEEFSLLVPLMPICKCKSVAQPSRTWELGEWSEITQQPAPQLSIYLPMLFNLTGKWFGELWNIDVGYLTDSTCPSIPGAPCPLSLTLHIHISIRAVSSSSWPWSSSLLLMEGGAFWLPHTVVQSVHNLVLRSGCLSAFSFQETSLIFIIDVSIF